MNETARRPEGFDAVKARLEEIADAVSGDDISLDQALDLFEEAVALGMQASDLLEEGVFPSEEGLLDAGQEMVGDAQAPQTAASPSMLEAAAVQTGDAGVLSV